MPGIKKRILASSLFCLFSVSFLFAQLNLSNNDKIEIAYKAQNMVLEFENLLNVISNENITLSLTAILIENSFSDSSANQLFLNQEVIIEDNIDPNHKEGHNAVDVSVERYLQDLDILYSKSADASIKFDNVRSGEVLEGDYVYVRVAYDVNFMGSHKEINQAYEPISRVAELRADKQDATWITRFVSIVFSDPGESFQEVDYGEPTADLLASTNESQSVAEVIEGLKKLAEIEEQNIRIQEQNKRIEEQLRRQEEEKDKAYRFFVNRGEEAMGKGDYAKALEEFGKAGEHRTPPELNERIRQAEALRNQGLAKEKYYQETLKKGRLYRLTRQYGLSLKYFNEADELKPGIDSIEQAIKKLEQRKIYLDQLKNQYTSTDFQSGVKVYTRELKNVGEDPDLYLQRALCNMSLNRQKQADDDLTTAIKLYQDMREAYILRGTIRNMTQGPAQGITDYSYALTINREDPNLLVQRAKLYLKMANTNAALEDYGQAIEFDPSNVSYYMARGKIHKDIRSYNEAIEDFSAAARIQENFAEAYYYRGLCYLEKEDILAAADDFEQARVNKLAENGLNHIKQISANYYNEGDKAFQSNDYELAIKKLTAAVQIRPNYPRAWYMRGEARQAAKSYLKANTDYTEAVRLEPSMYMAFYRRAQSKLALNKKIEAILDFEQTAKIQPSFHQASIECGDLCYELGRYDRALDSYDRAISQVPTLAYPHYMAGKIRVMKENFSPAVHNLTEAIKNQKVYPDAYYYRGLAYAGINNYPSSISDYSNCIKQKPNYPEAYFERGKILNKTNKASKALEDFLNATRYRDQYPEAHLEKARTAYQLKNYAIAASAYGTATGQNADFLTAETHTTWAYALLHNLKPSDAKMHFETAIAMGSKSPGKLKYGLACCEIVSGNTEEGLNQLEEILKTEKYPAATLKKDPFLKGVKKNKRFKQIVKDYGI